VAVEAVGDNDRLFSVKVPTFVKREEPVVSNATELTGPLWPSSVAVQAPVAASQSLMVLSYDADASVFES
jgi:hypothetical protein